MIEIGFAVISLGCVALALACFYCSRVMTGLPRVFLRNNVGMWLSLAAISTGTLLGWISRKPVDIPAVGWMIGMGNSILGAMLLVVGCVAAHRYSKRLVSNQYDACHEANFFQHSRS
jgi:hypothetical protein